MTNSYRIHFFHIIWSTKGRKPFIVSEIKERLYSYIGGIIRKQGGSLIAIGGTANHIHILIELSHLEVHTPLIRNVKSLSTAWIKKSFPEHYQFSWQDGYGSYTVSYSGLEKVKHYIANQEQHHRKQTFENEYREFLRLCNVDFDERYLLDV